MARRSGGGSRSSAFGRGRSPSPMASSRAPRPQPPPTQPKAMATQPAPTQVGQPMAAPGGGLMAQVATTAAGVAIGHTIGHALTGSLMGGGNHAEQAPVEQASQPTAQYQQQPLASGQEPCKFELDQFLACAQNQSNDLSLCDGFNHVLRECKLRYGNQHPY